MSKCTPSSVSGICQSNSNQLPEETPPRCWCCTFHLKNRGAISSHKAIPAAQVGENATFVKMKMTSLCSKESLWAQTNSEGQWIRKLAPPPPPHPALHPDSCSYLGPIYKPQKDPAFVEVSDHFPPACHDEQPCGKITISSIPPPM